MPFLCGIFILLRTHLLNVLFRWNFDHFSCQFRVILDIVSQCADDASQSVIPFEEIVLDGKRNFLKDKTLRVDHLKNFQHVYVLVKDILSNYTWNKQSAFNFATQLLANLCQKRRPIKTFLQTDYSGQAIWEIDNDIEDVIAAIFCPKVVDVVVELIYQISEISFGALRFDVFQEALLERSLEGKKLR